MSIETACPKVAAWIEQVEANLARSGRALPVPQSPLGAYRPVVVRNGIGTVAGQFPFQGHRLAFQGRVGLELDEEQAKEAACLSALNLLAVVVAWARESHRYPGLLRLDGYVASADGWTRQACVLDAASQLLVDALGPALGEHARAAFSVVRLPLDAPIELCLTFGALQSPHAVPHRSARMQPPDDLPRYRLLTGVDDASFCQRVSEAMALGYVLHGSPSVTFNGSHVVAAQALVWAGTHTSEGQAGG